MDYGVSSAAGTFAVYSGGFVPNDTTHIFSDPPVQFPTKPQTSLGRKVLWREQHQPSTHLDDPLDHRVEVDDRRMRRSFLCDPFAADPTFAVGGEDD